jgi:hypothetical protein
MNIKLLSGGGSGKRGYIGSGGGGAPATPLIVGSMFGNDIAKTIAMPVIDTYYPVPDSLEGGFENGMTFQNVSEILATVSGIYAAVWDMAVSTIQENPQTIAGCVSVDNVPCLNTQNITYPTISDFIYPLAGCGFIQIAAGQIARLALQNSADIQSVILNQASLTLIKIAEIPPTPAPTKILWLKGEDDTVDSINGNNGIFRTPAYDTGQVGRCFKVAFADFAPNEITINYLAGTDISEVDEWTYEFWFKADTANSFDPIRLSDDIGGVDFLTATLYMNGGGSVEIANQDCDYLLNPAVVFSALAFALNTWYKVKFIYNKAAKTWRFFVDDVEKVADGIIVQEGTAHQYTNYACSVQISSGIVWFDELKIWKP